MGNTHFLSFDDRTRRFKRERKRLARGYQTVVRPDGLIVYRPKPARGRFVKGLAWLAFGLLAFKVFLYIFLGPITYQTRVDTLAGGTVFEAAGAWVMQADAVTTYVADMVKSLIGMVVG